MWDYTFQKAEQNFYENSPFEIHIFELETVQYIPSIFHLFSRNKTKNNADVRRDLYWNDDTEQTPSHWRCASRISQTPAIASAFLFPPVNQKSLLFPTMPPRDHPGRWRWGFTPIAFGSSSSVTGRWIPRIFLKTWGIAHYIVAP